MRCCLYRHYDEHGVLLYVGITDAPHSRARDHALSSEWIQYARGGSVEWLDSRAEAEAAELRAIRNEAPVFNRVGASGDVDARIHAYKIGRNATVRALAEYGQRQARDELARRRATSSPEGAVSLAEVATLWGASLKGLRNARDRDPDFPEPVNTGARNTSLYRLTDLQDWSEFRAKGETI